MSYDLSAFPLPAGVSAADYVESEAYESADDSPPTEEERAAMERAAAALMALDPNAERVDGEHDIEINADTIQIGLFAREAAISVPYWYEGAEAEAVMERMFAYARVLSETLGYTVWDPQTETVVEGGSTDRGAATRVLGEISGRMDEIAQPAPRPWWKIWG